LGWQWQGGSGCISDNVTEKKKRKKIPTQKFNLKLENAKNKIKKKKSKKNNK
jgi:hypothetical protein